MLKIYNDFEEYLKDSYYINWNNEQIIKTAQGFFEPANEIETVRKTYEFVRDEIKHSWDIQDKRITITATDVLREGVAYAGQSPIFWRHY